MCHQLYLLAKYPHWQQKLDEELQAVFKDKYTTDGILYPTRDELNQLELLHCLIKESLRMYPPAASLFERVSVATDKEVVLGDYCIPGGTLIDVNVIAIHRNPQIWGNDAEEFKPERFLDMKHHVAYSYLPFGLGSRRCIGESFSLQEQLIILLHVVKQFRLGLQQQQELEWTKGSIQLLKVSKDFSLHIKAK